MQYKVIRVIKFQLNLQDPTDEFTPGIFGTSFDHVKMPRTYWKHGKVMNLDRGVVNLLLFDVCGECSILVSILCIIQYWVSRAGMIFSCVSGLSGVHLSVAQWRRNGLSAL